MPLSRPSPDPERARLADELAGLRAEVKALRTERDNTEQVLSLEKDVERLKLEKERLVEANDRKIRETEHRVGLLKLKQDHDVANTRRETVLEVNESNLQKDKDRFQAEMDFQREHLQREMTRFEGILSQILERLPVIEVALGGGVSTKKAG